MFDPKEVADALERAAAECVRGVLVPATGTDDLDAILDLASSFAGQVVAAIGVHPHEASSLDDRVKKRLEAATGEPGVVAIGEIGLDYHYMNSPREDQLNALRWQLDLASAAGLPVVLHNRESWSDLERELAARRGTTRGVCHSFAENADAARRVIELGLVVGISGMVTFKAADNIREMVSALQPGEVLVETDSPFLAPVPHRGRPNEPSYVPLVGRRLAEEWGVEPLEVARTSTRLFRDVFALGSGWPD
jgi:TatD DNase family protein